MARSRMEGVRRRRVPAQQGRERACIRPQRDHQDLVAPLDVLPQFVGLTFGVYNGHKFLPVQVNENMVGHKFGEFSPTRTFTSHAADKKARRG